MSTASSFSVSDTQTKDAAIVALSDLKERANETKEKAKEAAIAYRAKQAAVATKENSGTKTQANETKDTAIVALSDLKERANKTKEKAQEAAVAYRVKQAAVGFSGMKTQANETKEKTVVLACNPAGGLGSFATYKYRVQIEDGCITVQLKAQLGMCTITTAGGAVTLGGIGGAFGLASGVAVGSAAGLVPALLTFGLSIPAGAVVGGSIGLCTGTLVGGTAGGIGGFATYKYRVQIKDGFITVQVKAQDTLNHTKDKASAVLSTTRTTIDTQLAKLHALACGTATQVRKKSFAAVDIAKAKSSDALSFATTTKAGVTSGSAIAGAVVGGAGTGAVGTLAGAAVGIVPAIFTFGLSIPAGAIVGLCVGTTVGASTGAVGGGLAGYGGFTHRKAIAEGAQSSCSKVKTAATHVKAKTISCAVEAQLSARSMVRGSTGGSECVKAD